MGVSRVSSIKTVFGFLWWMMFLGVEVICKILIYQLKM
jgi:hypothetical protein